MHGLRKINNMYAPNGSGRDCIIYFDQQFRGGKVGYTNIQCHPGAVCESKRAVSLSKHRYKSFDAGPHSPSVEFSLNKTLNSLDNQAPRIQKQKSLNDLALSQAGDLLTVKKRAESVEGLKYSRSIGHINPLVIPRPGPKIEKVKSPRLTENKKPVPGDCKRHQYPGFSRTEYGGMWKA